ncbi:MAG: nucleoside 2-deoxyribosyltransferase [Euryarchaeota archaeon]|nr:nucleoside 2-deoxyribosyltransferase [Euryarchaeota archaeon]
MKIVKVFLSGSIRGGRQLLPTYCSLCDLLEGMGHEVVSAHVADAQVEEKELGMSELQIYERDMGGLRICDCLVAEVSVVSTGVGYEVCSAIARGLPVLCVHTPAAPVSAMILGNPNIDVREYADPGELEVIVRGFFEGIAEV